MNEMRLPSPEPLYRRVKRFVAERIQGGEWPEGHRVPSEAELMREFGASRMTVHRALRELSAEGLVTRVQGVGTFAAAGKAESGALEIRNIAAEIRARGHLHEAEPHLLRRETVSGDQARRLDMPDGAEAFRSLILHRENGVPVQLEDRYVNPALAPFYLAQDFTRITPNEYLMQVVIPEEAEHVIEAVAPDAPTRKLLGLGATEPCLLLERRTWARGAVVTWARLLHPGTRYRLGGRFPYRD